MITPVKIFKIYVNNNYVLNFNAHPITTVGYIKSTMDGIMKSYYNTTEYQMNIFPNRESSFDTRNIYNNVTLGGSWNIITDGYIMITAKNKRKRR